MAALASYSNGALLLWPSRTTLNDVGPYAVTDVLLITESRGRGAEGIKQTTSYRTAGGVKERTRRRRPTRRRRRKNKTPVRRFVGMPYITYRMHLGRTMICICGLRGRRAFRQQARQPKASLSGLFFLFVCLVRLFLFSVD